MVDWILGHTQRFKALISHAGVYDLTSEFGATEELWFPLWEYRRHAVGQAGELRQMVAQHLREGVQDADAGDSRRAGFPRAVHAGTGVVHRAADAEGAFQAAAFPGRRALGAEAAEQRALVQDIHRLDGFLGQKSKIRAKQ